jgi:hypothetical protein
MNLAAGQLALAFRRCIAQKSKISFLFLKSVRNEMMEWDDVKHFLAVARHGTLTKAARALASTPATVGRRIAALEAKLGARLFDRRHTGYLLS